MSRADPHHHLIKVSVRSDYLSEQSLPAADRYAFAYTVTIENLGRQAARLLDRHWVITDGHGRVQEVRGEGVVGEQPRIAPGESYRYTSGAVIATPVGSMQGSYGMIADDGTRFEAPIPPFLLGHPGRLH
ncbi:Co2+/Mg2+ efflux protein ApaG [Thioalkalicoccus limnaeus]|uniref:Protein ApaG n=1 Tax=Thioalkalicoccus limnaeus TaxID=120681 RepID=A0ABV4BDE3_9GAMM